jgi:hypothetical protein
MKSINSILYFSKIAKKILDNLLSLGNFTTSTILFKKRKKKSVKMKMGSAFSAFSKSTRQRNKQTDFA